MQTTVPSYHHDLGNGQFLEVFAIDPQLTASDLEKIVSLNDGKPNSRMSQDASLVTSVDSFDDLRINILPESYSVPQQLESYRKAVEAQSNAKGRYNGKVAIVKGGVRIPLQLIQAGFYDFLATKSDAIPAELDQSYPKERTISQLFNQWGLSEDRRARFLGFSYLLLTDDGNQLTLVQRAKGMAVASDCISVPGSTPNPDFSAEGFSFSTYSIAHITEEIEEEFKLGPSEFAIRKINLFEDRKNTPFCNIQIKTSVNTGEIAKRIYGEKQAIKEHPVIYGIPRTALRPFMNRFEVYAPIAPVIRLAAHL